MSSEKGYVRYSDFGAVGDGVTNDFFAIKAAHDYANEHKLPVLADVGRTYRITETEKDGVAEPARIMTETDWCGSTFIFDDTHLTWNETERGSFSANVFEVKSYYEDAELGEEYIEKINAAGGLRRNEPLKIDTGLGYPAMLVIRNTETRHFIRFGGNANSGTAQKEILLVDKDGNVDPTTPLLFDFLHVSSITAYRIDIPTLKIGNATIISKASRVNIGPSYHTIKRGIRVLRPNTHLYGIDHIIIGEIGKNEPVYEDAEGLSYSAAQDGYSYRDGNIYDKDGNLYTGGDVKPFIGHSYSGIIQAVLTHNILIEDCIFQARMYYLQGTYDLSANVANALYCKRCDQRNFFAGEHDMPLLTAFGKWWGVAGTNYCKNMVYDSCRLTRYDAHSGVVNGKIINCEIGAIKLTGGGDMLIENTTLYLRGPQTTVTLRPDYGATWDGTVTIRNSRFLDATGGAPHKAIFNVKSANHSFGYRTSFPNIVIDNLIIDNPEDTVSLIEEFDMVPSLGFTYRSVRDENIAFEGAICADGRPNENPYTPPAFIKVINNEKNGYDITVPDVPFFKDTEITGVKTVD